MKTAPHVSGRTHRIDLLTLALAAGAAVLSYGVAITLLIMIPFASATAGLAQFLVSGLAPLIAVALVYAVRVRDIRSLGLRGITGKWVLIAIGAGVLAILLTIVATVVTVVLTGPPSGLQDDYAAAATAGPALLVLTFIAGAILTPVGEELLFRGVLTNGLLRYGAWVAVPVSAAIFAVAHGINYITPVAFIIGIIAALMFKATGSIWPGVIVHGINNGYSILADAITSLLT